MSNFALINDLADQLANAVTAAGKKDEFLTSFTAGNDLLNGLDDIFRDGGEYRCEHLGDPIDDDLMSRTGITFTSIEDGAGYDDKVRVVERAAYVLTEQN